MALRLAGPGPLSPVRVSGVVLGALLPWLVTGLALFATGIGLEAAGEARGEGPYGPLRAAASAVALMFFPFCLGWLALWLPAALRALAARRPVADAAGFWRAHRRLFMGTAL